MSLDLVSPPVRTRRPKVAADATLSEHELTGILADAFYAFDMMQEVVRFDTLGRRWLFRMEHDGRQEGLRLQISHLGVTIWCSVPKTYLPSELGKPMIEEEVRKMARDISVADK